MRRFNTWNNVMVIDEEHEHHGRAGVVGDTKEYSDDEVPVLLDGETEELVFQSDELKAL